ncbi:hypothetical protein LWC34_51575 [Kibdelosporangium philippinense]|uniref:Uncharacterized protein n=1 Tax=Kibdelosporangium philippinense TaxID=211113 RepID=A0ABS8ZTX4_9PSEU|nr:hypothetical protein [Kibdelosporangium philippinense]MCE7011195.1 hypothetical protein [Kibdelosporangium philippinense]
MISHYKRLVLRLCFADTDIAEVVTPDFVSRGRAFSGPDVQVVGLVGEGTTVVLRVVLWGREQVQYFEGRDARLASRVCIDRCLAGQEVEGGATMRWWSGRRSH